MVVLVVAGTVVVGGAVVVVPVEVEDVEVPGVAVLVAPDAVTVKVPCMPMEACGSHRYVYVPGTSVTVQVTSPVPATSVA
jgi:hypothetical protein